MFVSRRILSRNETGKFEPRGKTLLDSAGKSARPFLLVGMGFGGIVRNRLAVEIDVVERAGGELVPNAPVRNALVRVVRVGRLVQSGAWMWMVHVWVVR